jgi:hypothetical protein
MGKDERSVSGYAARNAYRRNAELTTGSPVRKNCPPSLAPWRPAHPYGIGRRRPREQRAGHQQPVDLAGFELCTIIDSVTMGRGSDMGRAPDAVYRAQASLVDQMTRVVEPLLKIQGLAG